MNDKLTVEDIDLIFEQEESLENCLDQLSDLTWSDCSMIPNEQEKVNKLKIKLAKIKDKLLLEKKENKINKED